MKLNKKEVKMLLEYLEENLDNLTDPLYLLKDRLEGFIGGYNREDIEEENDYLEEEFYNQDDETEENIYE